MAQVEPVVLVAAFVYTDHDKQVSLELGLQRNEKVVRIQCGEGSPWTLWHGYWRPLNEGVGAIEVGVHHRG